MHARAMDMFGGFKKGGTRATAGTTVSIGVGGEIFAVRDRFLRSGKRIRHLPAMNSGFRVELFAVAPKPDDLAV